MEEDTCLWRYSYACHAKPLACLWFRQTEAHPLGGPREISLSNNCFCIQHLPTGLSIWSTLCSLQSPDSVVPSTLFFAFVIGTAPVPLLRPNHRRAPSLPPPPPGPPPLLSVTSQPTLSATFFCEQYHLTILIRFIQIWSWTPGGARAKSGCTSFATCHWVFFKGLVLRISVLIVTIDFSHRYSPIYKVRTMEWIFIMECSVAKLCSSATALNCFDLFAFDYLLWARTFL